MTKKVLITGASGYLANALLPCVSARANVVGIARNAQSIDASISSVSADICDRNAVFDLVQRQQPDAIIHCAACNPGGTDEQMFAINDIGTKHVAEAAQAIDCRLVSVSSDTVLDGTAAPYAEDAPASPLAANAYAVSKARGEQHISSILPSAIVVRTSLIYGIEQMDRGTAGFVERLEAGHVLTLFNDVIRQPVYDKALAEALCALAMEHTHVAGYTFGLRMLDYWGIDYGDKVVSKSAADIPGVPLDVRLTMQRAVELELASPGVSEVLVGPYPR